MPTASLPRPPPVSAGEVLRRYPHVCAHIICESLGYATPTVAGSILLAFIKKDKHYCEWVACLCAATHKLIYVKNCIMCRSTALS